MIQRICTLPYYHTIIIQVYPCWTGRRTKQGIPFYVYRINDLDKKVPTQKTHFQVAIAEAPASQKMHEFFNGSNIKKNSNSKTPPTVVALYESLLQLVTPMSTMLHDRPNLETPITQSFNVVDISGVSLRQFMTLRGHLGDASALTSSTYPETLHTIFVGHCPSACVALSNYSVQSGRGRAYVYWDGLGFHLSMVCMA